MMDAGLTVELLGEQPDELPADWLGDKRQLGWVKLGNEVQVPRRANILAGRCLSGRCLVVQC